MRKLLELLCLSGLALLLSGAMWAQTRTVRGTIVDETGQGVIGAAVIVKGTTNGVAADEDGRFQISCSPGSVLVISSIGYDEVEVTVGNQNDITVQLNVARELLDDVVVIGYGTTRAKNFTGSVDVVKMSDSPVADMGLQTTSDLLRGRLSGVVIGAESSRTGGERCLAPRRIWNSRTGYGEVGDP